MNRYKSNPSFVLRRIAGEHVLVSVGSGVASFCGVITLNETALTLWKKLQTGADLRELVDTLCEKFAVSEDIATADVQEILTLLNGKGMILCED